MLFLKTIILHVVYLQSEHINMQNIENKYSK